jgi:hypothetical protein
MPLPPRFNLALFVQATPTMLDAKESDCGGGAEISDRVKSGGPISLHASAVNHASKYGVIGPTKSAALAYVCVQTRK